MTTLERFRRRLASANVAGVHTVEHTVTTAVALSSVAAVWTAGNAGPVALTIDGRRLAQLAGDTTGIAVARFDTAEVVDAGRTIAVTMPTAGFVELQGDLR